ncbi:MAG: hypothetical protein UY94_C0028G0003 [Parcubacteria group bacterium GW2011_GWA2_56_21]|nr:MAG: hypothetical protein UY94_C0028G0003 [Parcubacteria group bacterium GW2011_GWA2_56_21]
MRSLIVGMLMFFAVAVSSDVDARGGRGRMLDFLLYETVGIFPSERALPGFDGVVFRWGRVYWPLSEFGGCFVEIRTPKEISWMPEPFSTPVEWQGENYGAHCRHDGFLDSRAFLYKYRKKERR